MRIDIRAIRRRFRPAAEPLVAFLYFVSCMVVFRGELNFDLVGMRRFVALWIVVLGLIAIAIAVSRISPRLSMALALGVIVTQFAWPMTRFWEGGWPIYFGLPIALLCVAASAPLSLRKTSGVLVGLVSVLISALITIPALGANGVAMLFAESASMGAGTVLRNFFAVLAAATVLCFAAWLTGQMLRGRTSRSTDDRPTLEALSGREQEVFSLAAQGLTNPEIADRLFVSEATVKSHMTSVLRKLDLTSRSRLIAFAHENTLVG